MLEDSKEWVVYSWANPTTKTRDLNAVPRRRWTEWTSEQYRYQRTINDYQFKLIAEGLTEAQAKQFVELAKESEG